MRYMIAVVIGTAAASVAGCYPNTPAPPVVSASPPVVSASPTKTAPTPMIPAAKGVIDTKGAFVSCNVPSLLGKNFEEIKSQIGAPTESDTFEFKGAASRSATWGKDEKDQLVILFNPNSKLPDSVMFEIGGWYPRYDADVLLKRLHLSIDDPRYSIRLHPPDSKDSKYFRVIVSPN